MAKRFIDTDIFKKQFTRSLKSQYKLLWLYVLQDCNHAGIWEVDFEVAELRTACKFKKAECETIFAEKIIVFDGGSKWFIPSFIEFQYGNQLVEKNRMHLPIITQLNKYGLMEYVNSEVVEEGTSVHAHRARITKKVKADILLRDAFTCQYCAMQYKFEELVVDHIISLTKGGNNDYENLAACCVRCNSHKTDLGLNSFLDKKLTFLNPTDFILKKLDGAYNSLNAPSKKLDGAMEQELGTSVKDSEKVMEKEKEKAKVHRFVPPTQAEVTAFFAEKGFSAALAKKAFEHYDLAEWHDAQGEKVKNWKQKMNTNWLDKPENTTQNGKRSTANFGGIRPTGAQPSVGGAGQF